MVQREVRRDSREDERIPETGWLQRRSDFRTLQRTRWRQSGLQIQRRRALKVVREAEIRGIEFSQIMKRDLNLTL